MSGRFLVLINIEIDTGRSSAGLEHLLWEQGVGGSNPLAPTLI